MKETLIIAIILGAFALLASLRAARLDAANAAKPRRRPSAWRCWPSASP